MIISRMRIYENDIPRSSESSWQVKNRQKERLGLEDVDSYQ